MGTKKILLLGGSGFIGSHIAYRLSEHDVELTIPTRRRERHKKIITLPGVEMPQIDNLDSKSLVQLVKDQDAVINLVGILHDKDKSQPYGKGFKKAHVSIPKRLVAACEATGVRRVVHISALGADPNGPSAYQRSKAAGEQLLREAKNLDVTIFRPSVVFGPEDSFLNLFAGLLRFLWVMPLGRANTHFQPVYVGDVASACVDSLIRPETIGKTYDLAGPKIYSLRELVEYVGKLTGHNKPVIGLPDSLARIQAFLLSLAPNPMMTPDNLLSMKIDNVASGAHNYPNWKPTPLEAIAPAYLGTNNTQDKLDSYRFLARR